MSNMFLNEIKAGCLSLWKLYGILPSVAAAQAALESGWGSSSLAAKYNNLFGIKGAGVSLPTTEYYDGKTPIGIVDSFRVYPNWNTSILDYGAFLTNYGNKPNRYDGAIGLRDSTAQITAIWKAGYATDPQYVAKIVATINANNLSEWDNEILNSSSNSNNIGTNTNQIKVIGLADDTKRLNVPKFQQKYASIYLANKIHGFAKGGIELNSIPQGHIDSIYNSLITDFKIPAAQVKKMNATTIHVIGLADDTQRNWVPQFQKKYAGIYLANDVNGNFHQTIELNNIPTGSDAAVIRKSLAEDFKIPEHQIK